MTADLYALPADEGASGAALPFPVVGVGASAGGVEALRRFLQALPADTGMAFVLLLHLDPQRDSRLAASLRSVRERLGAGSVEVQNADALAWMRRCAQRFALVLLDPPFDDDRMPALQAAAALLLPDGWLYVESPEPLQEEPAAALGLALHRAARAGAVHYHLLRRAGG